MKMQDTWFLLVISAIVAQLRLVGEMTGFNADSKPVVHSSNLQLRILCDMLEFSLSKTA